MTSGEELDVTPASMSSFFLESTNQVRNSLDPKRPLLEKYIQFTEAIAISLNNYFTFLEEDSQPDQPALIRNYMMQEMIQLWHIRKLLIRDLRKYFTNELMMEVLSQVGRKSRSQIIDICIDELDSIRKAVKTTLGNAVRAAQDDLSSEHVLAAQRQESRTAALQSLQSLAQEWETLSAQLSSAKDIADQHDSA